MEDSLLTIITLVITWKWGDWKHWKQYYSTILFWALGNLIYLYLTFDKPLWEFTTIIPQPLADLLMSLLIFPCVCLLFLPHFPNKKIVKKLLYIGLWVFLFSFVELWALQIHHFAYANGWKFLYSVIFNMGMFTLLQIHYKEPRWAWIISLIAGVSIMIIFKIPLNHK
ncbi:MAG: hypothetical protein P4L69_01215 [Desulfosporosinus sp.]|nr:hypothetical protein [Desulfosporosinus sp.]